MKMRWTSSKRKLGLTGGQEGEIIGLSAVCFSLFPESLRVVGGPFFAPNYYSCCCYLAGRLALGTRPGSHGVITQ